MKSNYLWHHRKFIDESDYQVESRYDKFTADEHQFDLVSLISSGVDQGDGIMTPGLYNVFISFPSPIRFILRFTKLPLIDR